MKKRKKKGCNREEILERLLCIAEQAHNATNCEKIDKSGKVQMEYDARCATIELKALEYAVKLSGIDCEKDEKDHEIFVILEEDAKEMAL